MDNCRLFSIKKGWFMKDEMIFKKRFDWKYVIGVVLLCLISFSVLAADRIYWIAADEVQWDYAPSFPINPMTGNEFTEDERVFVGPSIGT